MKIEKTPVNNMETVRKLQLKYRKLKAAFKRKFAEYVAHGQADDFIATILDDLSDESDEEIPDELVRLSQIYDHSDNISQSALLSLVDHSKYTKEMLMNVFRCSKYKIEQTRRLAASTPGFVLPKLQQLARSKLNISWIIYSVGGCYRMWHMVQPELNMKMAAWYTAENCLFGINCKI